MKNADMPAMPVIDADATPMSHKEISDWRDNSCLGFTKREMMAMHMMSALLASSTNATHAEFADAAVKSADALLAELDRTSITQHG